MDKRLRGIIITACAMIAAGVLLAGIGFVTGGRQTIHIDRDGIHVGAESQIVTGKEESFSEELTRFSSIKTDLDYYPVELIPDDRYAIEAYYNSSYGKPSFRIENDTLIVEDENNRKLKINLDLPGLDFLQNNDRQGVRIYYPKDAELKDIAIHGGASDLSFQGLSAETAEFDLDFGKLDLSDLTARKVNVEMDSGDCSLENITADELHVETDLGKATLCGAKLKTLEIKADSGDVTIRGADIDSCNLKVELGKLTGQDLKLNGLKAENSSGDIILQGTFLGVTDVSCELGKITINTDIPRDQYNYELNTDLGKVSVEGEGESGSFESSNHAANTLKLETDLGDINVVFQQ